MQSLAGGTRTIVQRGGFYGRYLPSGHLVFIHDETLFAAPFDLNRLEVTGQPVPALQGVTSNSITGGAQFSLSATGSLVYLPGTMKGTDRPIEWMNHDGTTSPLRPTAANWFDPHFLARWPPARDRDPPRHIGHLDLRVGAGHAHALDVRPITKQRACMDTRRPTDRVCVRSRG